MKNKRKHERKFFSKIPSGDEEFKRMLNEKLCTKEGAKEVIDDLNETEFQVVVNVLLHIYAFGQDFKEDKKAHKELAGRIKRFLTGKTIQKVIISDDPYSNCLPRLLLSGNNFFDFMPMVTIPSSIFYHWGKIKREFTKPKKTP